MKPRILLIDDEELITRTLAIALEKAGYDVLVAKRGEDAVVMAEEEEFDLLVSDIRMPGLNGVETVRKIVDTLKARGASKIPTIFLTGYADKAIEEQAYELSPFAYIYKPFDYIKFMEKVKEAIHSRKNRK